MGILKVANTHFDAAGSSRLEYLGGNVTSFTANTGGIRISQNALYPVQSNTLSIGTSTRLFSNAYVGSNRTVHLGTNIKMSQNSKGLIILGGNTSFDKPIKNSDGDTISPQPPTFQLFTANGTWTKPDGCRYIRILMIGGGGGGGGAQYAATSQGAVGGGGSSGTTAMQWLDVTNWSNTTTVTIGSGGTAGSSSGGNGGFGGTTSFGTHVTATGGEGGVGMTAGTSLAVIGGEFSSDFSSAVDTTIFVDSGQATGYPALRMSGTLGFAGRGGEGLFGGACASWKIGSQASYDGLYGGGGGGGSTGAAVSSAGGVGGDGCVYIEEFY